MFGVMAWIIPVFVACSTFGAANGSALSSGRYESNLLNTYCYELMIQDRTYLWSCLLNHFSVFYAASKNGELPKFMAMIHNARFTPIPGLIVQVSSDLKAVHFIFIQLSNIILWRKIISAGWQLHQTLFFRVSLHGSCWSQNPVVSAPWLIISHLLHGFFMARRLLACFTWDSPNQILTDLSRLVMLPSF